MRKVDRIDAITELYSLGKQATAMLDELVKVQDQAIWCRLLGQVTKAQQLTTEAALIERELEVIAAKQTELMEQLESAGEMIFL